MDNMDDEVEVELGTEDRKDWDELRAIAEEEQGITIVEAKNLEPFTMMILVGTIFTLAGVVLKWVEGRGRGGLVVDLRPDQPDPIYRDQDMHFGQIIIITPTSDGKDIKVSVETYDPDNDFTKVGKAIFEKLAEGVTKSIESLKNIIEEAVGNKGEISVEDQPVSA